MTEPSLEKKALMVIEALAGGEFEVNQKIFEDIYKYAHIGRSPSCMDSHKDWVAELEDLYNKMKGDLI